MARTADANSEPLGLTFAPSRTILISDLIDLVESADELGYHSFWLPETWGADAVSLLATLAVRTRRILLASGVFNVYSRTAALLAQTAATLQELSGGRFILGLGSSGPGVVEPWHGVSFNRPVERTREYIDVIRLALSGERVEHNGPIGKLRGFRLSLLPTQSVPVYVAALGPRNIRMVGEKADGWLPIFAARGHMGPLFTELRAGEAAAQRRPGSVCCAAYIPFAVGPRAERLLRQQLAHYVGGMGSFYFNFVSRVGFEDTAAVIRAKWKSGDRIASVDAVRDELLDLCTLGSDASDGHVRLRDFRRQGVDIPVLALPHGCTRVEALDAIRALAPA